MEAGDKSLRTHESQESEDNDSFESVSTKVNNPEIPCDASAKVKELTTTTVKGLAPSGQTSSANLSAQEPQVLPAKSTQNLSDSRIPNSQQVNSTQKLSDSIIPNSEQFNFTSYWQSLIVLIAILLPIGFYLATSEHAKVERFCSFNELERNYSEQHVSLIRELYINCLYMQNFVCF